MNAATELERLVAAFAAPALARDALIQLAAAGVALAVAWAIARKYRHPLVFPVTALVLAWAASLALRSYGQVPFLDLAVVLLVVFAVIRFATYVLRHVLPDGAMLRGFGNAITWAMWIGVTLYLTGLLPVVGEALDSVAFPMGKQRISMLLILQGAVAVAVTLAIAMWFARLIEGRVMANDRVEMSTRVVVSKAVRALAFFIAVIVALPMAGLDLTALAVFGGALGVGLGFGLQKIASNYVSGYIILLDHSIRIGDLVTVDNRHGVVREIASRYTVVQSSDGTESIIPNETLITQSVTNHSYSDKNAAVKVPVTLGYESDLDAAFEVLVDAARKHPRVIADPAPGAAITRLAETGIEVELTAWIKDPEQGAGSLRGDLLKAALKGFRERSIVVPPPPREILLKATPEMQISSNASRG